MALTLATLQSSGSDNPRVYSGGLGASDNDIVVQTGDVSAYREFLIHTTAGAADVVVSLDGTNYNSAALSLTDLGSASFATAVVVTAANRVYKFSGCFKLVRILQAGATPPADVTLLCYR
jgi:hypothetical protein